jgi:hypothetical protein
MVIHDLDIAWPALRPDEANAPLVVDPDAMLASTIARRRGEVAQHLSVVQLSQLPLSNALEIRSDPSGEAAMKQGLGIPIGERVDHRGSYTRIAL